MLHMGEWVDTMVEHDHQRTVRLNVVFDGQKLGGEEGNMQVHIVVPR